MALSDEQLLKQLGDTLKNLVISKQKARGIVASGRSAASLRVESDEITMRLYGDRSFFFQEYGRGPTKSDNRRPLYFIIRKWIDDKGITPLDISKNTLAFLISRKIHREGTQLYRKLNKGENNPSQPVGLEEAVEEIRNRYKSELAKRMRVSVRSEILKNLPG